MVAGYAAGSSSLRRSPRSRAKPSSPRNRPRRRSPRKILPETEEIIALKKKLKLTAPDEICAQLNSTSTSTLKFEDVRDVFRDPPSAVGSQSDVSRWLTPSPSQDLSQ